MKKRGLFHQFIKPSVAVAAMLGFLMPAYADSLMTSPKIYRCTSDGKRCLKAESASAVGGELAPIFYMKDITVTLEDKEKKETEKIHGARGYLDFDNEQLVLIESTDKVTKERIFNLKKIESKLFVGR